MVSDRHAIVIGSGIGGLLAARVLLDHVGRVTIVDRDRFPERPDHRAGVPQSQHLHGLLPRGAEIVYELFPGLQAELRADGARAVPSRRRAKIVTPAGLLPVGGEAEGGFFLFSRFLLEWRLRQRLSADPRVRLSPGTEVLGLSAARRGPESAVRGVRVRYRDEISTGVTNGAAGAPAVLDADLVVDASGRSSRAPEWLAELGYGQVAEETMHSALSYASRFYARPPEFPDEFSLVIINGRPPHNPRAGLVQDIENGVWHVTLGGIAGAIAPLDEQGFLQWASQLPDPSVYETIRVARPLTPIRGWRTPTNRLRRFERMPHWPEGFVVTGDAVCALNPIYGQGMTVAAMDAVTLRDTLVDHDSGARPGFARRFQRRLARVVATPWLMASSEDLRWESVRMEGARPPRVLGLARRWVDAVMGAAVDDPVLAAAYFDVIGFTRPLATLFAPAVVARVARGSGRRLAARVSRTTLPASQLALSADGLAQARALPACQQPILEETR